LNTKELDSLFNDWKACQRCPLANLRNRVVFGNGNPEAKLVMIGEAPGETEDIEGKPFVGKAGETFNKMLEFIGLSRDELWITNTCLCRPKVTDQPGRSNRAPNANEIAACNPRLLAEIDIIKPAIVVLAGNTPLYAVTGKKGITKHRGWQDAVWQGKSFSTNNVYATLHPASVLYGSTEQVKQKKLWMLEDWQEISRKLNVIKTGEVQKEGSKATGA
jgi:uracil-DNA glycosylase family 4